MALSDLNLDYQYRPDQGNIVDDFYIPCLAQSSLYQRAVGYFTSGSLALAARGLSEFIRSSEGRMKLIASPVLSAQDLEALKLGYKAREDVVAHALLRGLQGTTEDIIRHRLSFLAWLIAEDRLDVKIALISDAERHGIYHEKIGTFHDDQGNIVAFSGSSNETEGGLYSNFEAIEVFASWREGDVARVQNKCRDFSKLWSNQTRNLEVLDLPEAALKGLIEYRRFYDPAVGDLESRESSPQYGSPLHAHVRIPTPLTLRPYQKEAVKAWFQNGGSGIFEMATGTGKTVTALTTAAKLYEKLGRLGVFIVAPYKHLVDQWEREVKAFGFRPVIAYESRASWEGEVTSELTAFQLGVRDNYAIITTNATLFGDAMQATLGRISNPCMIVADEAHHLGAQHYREKLPANIKYRLGLSATPNRWYDDEGSGALSVYFAPGVIFEYGLKKAIEAGYLTPYKYYPHVVDLTEEENKEYRDLSRQIFKAIAGSDKAELEDSRLQHLLLKRARLINRAENKLVALRELLQGERDSHFNLFYCGDAKTDGERQIDLIVRLLGNELGMKVHPFTSEESLEERQVLLRQFESGVLQGLVAIRCLDEGVDVPATQTAYILASSTNPREFIQRRGRILRRHPSKDIANIHDFVVSPRDLNEVQAIEPEVFNLERKLARKELMRVLEFANTAANGPQASLSLQSFKKTYNLLDM